MTDRKDPTRRTFVRSALLGAAGAAAGMVGAAPLARALASHDASHLPVDDLTFDLHLHPGQFFARGLPEYTGDSAVLGTLRAMPAGGVGAGFVSLVADAPIIARGATGVTVTGNMTPAQAEADFHRQLAVWLACEGSEGLAGYPERVDVLWDAGIRSIQLVHYAPNAAGDLQTQPPQHGGLSAFGAAVVRRMVARRMVIDVAHAALSTVRDVVRLVSGPIILSHTLLRIDDARLLAARTITPDHARLVASTGGVIGAWPSATNASFAEFVENTKRLADVVGVEHVGLGTDMDGNLRPVLASYGQFRDWMSGLAASGFTTREVALMAGGNMERVLSQVVG